jgi:hypothetical protein
MSGIINKFLDEARAGKHGPHVIATYETKAEAMKSDNISPTIKQSAAANLKTTTKPAVPDGVKTVQLCDHYQIKGECLVAGCKYGRYS